MIKNITYTAYFDRPLKETCIPDECSFVMRNGTEIHLNFIHNDVSVEENNRRVAHIERIGLDTTSCLDSSSLTVRDILSDLMSFSSLGFYTGVAYEPILTGITDMYIGFTNGEIVKVPQRVLNNYFCSLFTSRSGAA